jgi:hypothetical protein
MTQIAAKICAQYVIASHFTRLGKLIHECGLSHAAGLNKTKRGCNTIFFNTQRFDICSIPFLGHSLNPFSQTRASQTGFVDLCRQSENLPVTIQETSLTDLTE